MRSVASADLSLGASRRLFSRIRPGVRYGQFRFPGARARDLTVEGCGVTDTPRRVFLVTRRGGWRWGKREIKRRRAISIAFRPFAFLLLRYTATMFRFCTPQSSSRASSAPRFADGHPSIYDLPITDGQARICGIGRIQRAGGRRQARGGHRQAGKVRRHWTRAKNRSREFQGNLRLRHSSSSLRNSGDLL